MSQLAAATTLLGATLQHHEVRCEKQLSAEDQLREAKALLEQARSCYAADPKVLERLNAADREVSQALATR
jgi:hypothetical protein